MWCTTGNSLNINDIQYIFIASYLILYDRLIDNASVNEIIFISLTLLKLVSFRKELQFDVFINSVSDSLLQYLVLIRAQNSCSFPKIFHKF